MFKWNKGRQGGGYEKLSLVPAWLSYKLKFDAFILKIPSETFIPKHTDPVSEDFEHYRINVTLKKPINNARMYILGPVKRWWRIEKFRPDLYEHGLEPIKGNMYLLSFGYAKRKPIA